MLRTRLPLVSLVLAFAFGAADAAAQQPYPPQPYPPQPAPYPPQPQPYPAQPYPPQPQPYPAQPYPPQPQAYPPQPQPYPPQPYPAQPYPPQPYPPPAPVQTTRGGGEMAALYVTSAIYGVGSGIWLDALFKLDDPGGAIIMPIILGAAAPIGAYFWDARGGPLHKGVPASISAGLVLGGVEGIAIAGTQWQYTHESNKDWSFQTQTTVTWILASGGAVGGWAFGEWLRPNPRGLTFIGSSAGWGALSGSLIGVAVQGRHDDWKDGSSVAGLIGYNLGIAAGGAINLLHTPSYNSQKWMWVGYGVGALAGCILLPLYAFQTDPDLKRGLIGPALGGLAGTALAGALTWNMPDDDGSLPTAPKVTTYKPPVDLSVSPVPALTPAQGAQGQTTAQGRSLAQMVGPDQRFTAAPPGAMLTAVGEF